MSGGRAGPRGTLVTLQNIGLALLLVGFVLGEASRWDYLSSP